MNRREGTIAIKEANKISVGEMVIIKKDLVGEVMGMRLVGGRTLLIL